jgi:dTDP-4-dehydrorhamnose 3,5-epimerase-like enzyme
LGVFLNSSEHEIGCFGLIYEVARLKKTQSSNSLMRQNCDLTQYCHSFAAFRVLSALHYHVKNIG